MLEWCGTYPLGRALMLGFKLALVGFGPSSTPRCAGVLGVPERSVCQRLAALGLALLGPNQGIASCRHRPVRDRAHNHCDPLFAFSLNPEMQRIHNQRSVQCTGDRDGRQETPMGATAPSERPL